jgi:hypothetical protein
VKAINKRFFKTNLRNYHNFRKLHEITIKFQVESNLVAKDEINIVVSGSSLQKRARAREVHTPNRKSINSGHVASLILTSRARPLNSLEKGEISSIFATSFDLNHFTARSLDLNWRYSGRYFDEKIQIFFIRFQNFNFKSHSTRVNTFSVTVFKRTQ